MAIARKSEGRTLCLTFMSLSLSSPSSSFSSRPSKLVNVCAVQTGQATTVDPVRPCSRWRVGSLFQHCVSSLSNRHVRPAIGPTSYAHVLSFYSVVYPLDVCVFGDTAPSSRDRTDLFLAYPAPRLEFRQRRGRTVRSRNRGSSVCSL